MRFIEPITLKRLIKSNALSDTNCDELKSSFSRSQLKLIDRVVLNAAQTFVKSDLRKTDHKIRSDIPLLKHGVFAAADIHKVNKKYFVIYITYSDILKYSSRDDIGLGMHAHSYILFVLEICWDLKTKLNRTC